MSFDRHRWGVCVLRVCLGLFFLGQGLTKIPWFANAGLLTQQLAGWERGVAVGSLSARYLEHVAIPYAGLFARLVPLAEIATGVALLAGFRTTVFALLAFAMVLNFHFASGTIFRYAFVTNAYGLPVLGGLLAVALGGAKLR